MPRQRSIRRCTAAVAALVAATASSGCQASAGHGTTGPLIVVSAPLSGEPWVGRSVERGARLAVDAVNRTRPPAQQLRLEVMDNAASPARAQAQARQAVADHAAALLTDGTGALAMSSVSGPASLPLFVVFDGGASIVDPTHRPTVFRLAPSDRAMSRRLADYLSARAHRVALISDDSSYGRDGAAAVRAALGHNAISISTDQVLPAGAADASPQVLRAKAAGADAVLVWAGAPVLGATVRAARATGWTVPLFTSPTAEDPVVRQQLAGHPQWLDGLTFVSFRITSEQGPGPFAAFRAAFEGRYGPDQLGLVADGRPVVQPPDWATYPWDAVHLLAAALTADGGRIGVPLLNALESTVVTGANGDERGFGPGDREGVSPSDMYFARFHHLRFAPVTDDLLSTRLPTVAQ